MELQPGTIVDQRYQLIAQIGQGGQATVYKVRHSQLGTLHALKVVGHTSASVRARLLDEGRVQASLKHPNVVNVTDVVEVDGLPGLIMEWVHGPDLNALLHRNRLALDQIDPLMEGILSGVAHAHRKGFVHRDLKPHNILCAIEDGELIPKIVDFGLVKALDGESAGGRTRTGQFLGTPAYMAPEQIRDTKGVDARADVWALGVILYEMLTNRIPFHGDDTYEMIQSVMSGVYTDPRLLVPDLPERMAAMVEAALKPELAARASSCKQLLRIFTGKEEFKDSKPPAPQRVSSRWSALDLNAYTAEPDDTMDPASPEIRHGPPTMDGLMSDDGMISVPRTPTLDTDGAGLGQVKTKTPTLSPLSADIESMAPSTVPKPAASLPPKAPTADTLLPWEGPLGVAPEAESTAPVAYSPGVTRRTPQAVSTEPLVERKPSDVPTAQVREEELEQASGVRKTFPGVGMAGFFMFSGLAMAMVAVIGVGGAYGFGLIGGKKAVEDPKIDHVVHVDNGNGEGGGDEQVPPPEPTPEPKVAEPVPVLPPPAPTPTRAASPAPVSPEPTPEPVPQPLEPDPEPEPVPAPEPAPAPVTPTLGGFSVNSGSNNATSVWLTPIGGGKKYAKSGDEQIPPGTYEVHFTDKDWNAHTANKTATITPGKTLSIYCLVESKDCVIK